MTYAAYDMRPLLFWSINFLFESYDHVIEFHFWFTFKLLESTFGPDLKFVLDQKFTYDSNLLIWYGLQSVRWPFK